MKNAEQCMNPWNGKCKNSDIELYIWLSGRKIPICRSCWEKISDKEIEWGLEKVETGRH